MSDPLLRRIERRAVLFTAGFVLVALVVPGGGWRAAAGVLGGALLAGVSYWAIGRSVNRVLAGGVGGRRARLRAVALFFGRYALLAGMAYVMIARLRLPPVGLLGGASVIAAAVAVEAARRHSSSEV